MSINNKHFFFIVVYSLDTYLNTNSKRSDFDFKPVFLRYFLLIFIYPIKMRLVSDIFSKYIDARSNNNFSTMDLLLFHAKILLQQVLHQVIQKVFEHVLLGDVLM